MVNISHWNDKIKTPLRYHLTPFIMATMETKENVLKMWGKWNPFSLLVGDQTDTTTMKICVDASKQTNKQTNKTNPNITNWSATWPSCTTPGNIYKEYIPGYRETYTSMFIATLFKIVRQCKQPGGPISWWADNENVVNIQFGILIRCKKNEIINRWIWKMPYIKRSKQVLDRKTPHGLSQDSSFEFLDCDV